MKKISILILFIFLLTTKGYGQCQNQNIEYKTYPGICVDNAIKWLNMIRYDWNIEMKKYDFSKTGFGEQGEPYFSSSDEHWDIGVQLIIAKDFGLLQIKNIPISDSKKNMFQGIINELEPYYNRREGNWNYFTFKYTDGVSYQFAINQSNTMDLIFVTKK